MFWMKRKRSGSKEYAVVTADTERELARLARALKVDVHGKGAQEKHLDVKGHRLELVSKKYGAVEKVD